MLGHADEKTKLKQFLEVKPEDKRSREDEISAYIREIWTEQWETFTGLAGDDRHRLPTTKYWDAEGIDKEEEETR